MMSDWSTPVLMWLVAGAVWLVNAVGIIVIMRQPANRTTHEVRASAARRAKIVGWSLYASLAAYFVLALFGVVLPGWLYAWYPFGIVPPLWALFYTLSLDKEDLRHRHQQKAL
jgi:hypothetical protein